MQLQIRDVYYERERERSNAMHFCHFQCRVESWKLERAFCIPRLALGCQCQELTSKSLPNISEARTCAHNTCIKKLPQGKKKERKR